MIESAKLPTVRSLVAAVGGRAVIKGEISERIIRAARRTGDADRESIAFIDPERRDKREMAETCNAGVLVCDLDDIPPRSDQLLIISAHPKLLFAELVERFYAARATSGIHPSAVVHPEAVISPTASVGALCAIGRATVGDNSVIASGVVIYDGVSIGRNVTIAAGTVIGAAGFGYLHDDQGRVVNFPHIAGVTIEDDVEVGANTTIDRGALSDTILRRGCKVDNLVHVAHNVVIGENAMVIANTMIGGSTVIGDGAYIAPSVTLRDVISVGAGATVGLAAVVTKSVPDGETWTGSPAVPMQEFSAQRAKLKKLLA